MTQAPMRKVVVEGIRNASVGHLKACNNANAARQYDAAITACQAATARLRPVAGCP